MSKRTTVFWPGDGLESAASDEKARQRKELGDLARNFFRSVCLPGTVQTQVLLKELGRHLARQERWRGLPQECILAVAAGELRRTLRQRAWQEGIRTRGVVILELEFAWGIGRWIDLVDVERVLDGLAGLHPRLGRVAELRLLTGMRGRSIASVLQLAPRTVMKDCRLARAYARRVLTKSKVDTSSLGSASTASRSEPEGYSPRE